MCDTTREYRLRYWQYLTRYTPDSKPSCNNTAYLCNTRSLAPVMLSSHHLLLPLPRCFQHRLLLLIRPLQYRLLLLLLPGEGGVVLAVRMPTAAQVRLGVWRETYIVDCSRTCQRRGPYRGLCEDNANLPLRCTCLRVRG